MSFLTKLWIQRLDVKEDLVEEAPADYPNAKKGNDGQWYIPDPNKAGKFLKVVGIWAN